MARVLISGASGFVGRPLASFLSASDFSVVPLIRSSSGSALSGSVVWSPETEEANLEDFDGFDAVVHLAGEPLALSRWSPKKQQAILRSRTRGTLFLSSLLSRVRRPPRLFISASAVGYYGNRGEEILTEQSSAGTGFLASVCSGWEESSSGLKGCGTRVVAARLGIVLGADGGALQKMLLPYWLGLGGRLGSGKQWVSWIHRDDLIRAILHIFRNDSLQDAVNLVAPYPIRQEEFASTLASLLRRPHVLSVPGWALRWAFGLAADEMILSSTRVDCAKLLASNFSFTYPDLRSALYQALQM